MMDIELECRLVNQRMEELRRMAAAGQRVARETHTPRVDRRLARVVPLWRATEYRQERA
jgi:hypothetical protein